MFTHYTYTETTTPAKRKFKYPHAKAYEEALALRRRIDTIKKQYQHAAEREKQALDKFWAERNRWEVLPWWKRLRTPKPRY